MLDRGCFVLIPPDRSESPLTRWTIELVNSGAKNVSLASMEDPGLNNAELVSKTGSRPPARSFHYHSIVTLLRSRRYRQPGWEKSWTDLRTGQPWATPGPYTRQSMLMALARQVDEVADSDVETLLSEQGAFDGEGLPRREEDELSRLVWVAPEHVRWKMTRRLASAAM